ncbi:MAG: YfhO family protein [Chloroflexi bacterium]|nr:YfhO family protein [Chloroflexota bacterium]
MIRQIKSDWLAFLLLAGLPLAIFAPAALRQAVFFFGDISLFFLPTHLAYADALKQLRLPLWDPRMFAGFPLFAEGQIAALYPTHPLLYGLLPIDIATNYDILLHLGWVAIGTYLFARALNLQRPSAFLGGLAFGLGGFFVARMQHMSVLATASWLPWLLWTWERAEHAPNLGARVRWLALMTLFSGFQLFGGHPQFAFLSAILVGLYALINWQRDNSPSPAKRGRAGVGAVLRYFDPLRAIPAVIAFSLGAGMAAVQLMPTFELGGFSDRAAGLLPKFFNAFSLRPIHYAMLFHPFIQGNPYPNVSVEVIGYIGLLPVVLAMLAPVLRRERRVIFFALIALTALFLGLGDQNIFYRALRYLPLFNYFRVPSRFFFWYSFAAAMLAAFAFDALLVRAKITARVTRGQVIALTIAALGIALVAGLMPALPLDAWLGAWVWLPVIFALISVWVLLGARRGLFTRTTLVALTLGITAIDLGLFASVYSKTYDATTSVQDFSAAPPAASIVKNGLGQDGRVLTSLWIYPVFSTMRESLYPNISMTYDVPNAISYTPLIPQRTGEYLESISAPMVNLLNVRYYILPQLLPTDPKTEGNDLNNDFGVQVVLNDATFPAVPTTKIKLMSSIAQSVDYPTGTPVARVQVMCQDGMRTFTLRAGDHTAEWAYDRTDVLKVIKHARPAIATTYPARSAFPTESHDGHTFLAEFDLTREGNACDATSIYAFPLIPYGLIRIERVLLVTSEGREISLAHLQGQSDYALIYRSNYVAIYENYDALPRAFLVHHARVADDKTALKEMSRATFQPRETLILSDGAPLDAGGAQTANESARIVENKPERVVVTARVETDAYLLLTDSWYPGWIARVDGFPTPIQRADYIFRAVRLAPGEHRIEFEYRPSSLYLGAGISAIALLIVIGAFVGSRRFSV